jgi:hypothetical protein
LGESAIFTEVFEGWGNLGNLVFLAAIVIKESTVSLQDLVNSKIIPISSQNTAGGAGSVGDMTKSVYDQLNTGVVDNTEHLVGTEDSFDDDTAAGVGGKVTGEYYQTTGSGSAPLNAAGIVMIKQ